MAEQRTWFTADSHFGNENIIKMCNRPFVSVEHMEEELIGRWNAVVDRDDIVYHLGDFFSFKKREMDLNHACSICNRLNGKIWLLRGNHDDQEWLHHPTLRLYGWILPPYVDCVVDYVKLPDGSKKRRELILCHYPLEDWQNRTHGTLHLHGHAHGNASVVQNRFDVGVDVQDFRPVSLQALISGSSNIPFAA